MKVTIKCFFIAWLMCGTVNFSIGEIMDCIRYSFFSLFVLFAGVNSSLFGTISSSHWDTHMKLVMEKLPSFPGWCTKERAEILMNFIHRNKPNICVEIGAFGGSTTYPIVSALSFAKEGVLYTIDAWDNQVAVQGLPVNDPNIPWWSSLDMNAIYEQFITAIRPYDKWCKPIRQRSEDAVQLFSDESIDLLYIDGNFSVIGAFQDVVLYFPKVKKGGYIWINDANSAAKHDAVTFLMENSYWIKKESIRNECIVFQKHM